MGLLGHMVVLLLVFKGISILSSIVTIPIDSAERFLFLHTLSSPVVVRFFDYGHSVWDEVISWILCDPPPRIMEIKTNHIFKSLLLEGSYIRDLLYGKMQESKFIKISSDIFLTIWGAILGYFQYPQRTEHLILALQSVSVGKLLQWLMIQSPQKWMASDIA